MSAKALVILAHPHLNRSISNKAIFKELSKSDKIEIRNLYDLYPNYFIDAAAEQESLLKHEIIVLQHPFFWYNMPSLLKLWFDEVFAEGFAFGKSGIKLADKKLLLSITTGGGEQAYSTEGINRVPIETYLESYVQTANLCKMKWEKPNILFAGRKKSADEIQKYAEDLRSRIENLVKDVRI